MNERKKVIRIFFAWQDEKEERWLEEMARQGWHMVKGGFVYEFERGPVAEVRYRLDYRPGLHDAPDEYFALFRDAGWEYVGRCLKWRYFRTADPSAPEIFTDSASRIGKYRRLLAVLVAVFGANVAIISGSLAATPESRHAGLGIVRALQVAVLLLLAYAVLRVALILKRLKRSAGSGA